MHTPTLVGRKIDSMEFDLIIAVDWCGRMTQRGRTSAIQVAECNPRANTVTLVNNPAPGQYRWRRQEVLNYILQQCENQKILVGLDFAFSYPYCYGDGNVYFPHHPNSPAHPQALWETVDAYCRGEQDLYGGTFCTPLNPTFAPYYWYRVNRRYRQGGQFDPERMRSTEQRCRQNLNVNPLSVFKCVFQNVGLGSLAGFRLLHRLHGQAGVSIWPFDWPRAADALTVVEIYPRVFLQMAGINLPDRQYAAQTQICLQHFGVNGVGLALGADWSGDKRDALVSAAGMMHLSQNRGNLGPRYQAVCPARRVDLRCAVNPDVSLACRIMPGDDWRSAD